MTREEFEQVKDGDFLMIKPAEVLRNEFPSLTNPSGIEMPHYFNHDMLEYCGLKFKMEERFRRAPGCIYWSGYIWDYCVIAYASIKFIYSKLAKL